MAFPSGHAARLLMGCALVVAVVSGVMYFRLPWRSSGDFDIIGFLFVMLNLPKLFIGVLFLFSLAALIGAVSRVFRGV